MFYILELQTNNGTPAYIVQTANTYNEAMNKYYTILAAAAISEIDIHACAVFDEFGQLSTSNFFIHGDITPPEG